MSRFPPRVRFRFQSQSWILAAVWMASCTVTRLGHAQSEEGTDPAPSEPTEQQTSEDVASSATDTDASGDSGHGSDTDDSPEALETPNEDLLPPWRSVESAVPAVRTDAPIEVYGSVPNPGVTHHFQMPTARPLAHGDMMVTIAGYLGWLGVRYGFTPRFDMGVGLPIYLAGISIDARYALALGENSAVSLWGYASVPVLPGDGNAADFFGFTWRGGGAAWVAGPVASVWNDRVGLHVGVHAAQRVLLGGIWAMVHATVEARIVESLRVIVQGIVLAEVINESPSNAGGSVLVGTYHPRVFPYLIAGIRLYSRRFSVDVGGLIAFEGGSPLAGNGVTFWPWTSVSQMF
jgi:hypothetical protein